MPKQVDHNDQRRAIAGAAISVIDRQGLDGARLRDVARAANVTTGAVTHYFDSKDAVLEAALSEIVRRILNKQETTVSKRAANATDALVDLAFAFMPTDAESRGEWRVWLAFWGRATANERLRAIHRDYYAAIVAQLVEGLAANPPAGRSLSREAARTLADAVIAAIDGVGTRATLEPEEWPPARQRATLALLLSPMTHEA